MPSKDYDKMVKLIDTVHKHRENVDDPYYDGVPLIVLTNVLHVGIHKAYLLAKQAELYDKTIKYKRGLVFHDGGRQTE